MGITLIDEQAEHAGEPTISANILGSNCCLRLGNGDAAGHDDSLADHEPVLGRGEETTISAMSRCGRIADGMEDSLGEPVLRLAVSVAMVGKIPLTRMPCGTSQPKLFVS